MTPVPCRGGAPASGRDRNPAVLGPSERAWTAGRDRSTGKCPRSHLGQNRCPGGTNRAASALLVHASPGLAAGPRPWTLKNSGSPIMATTTDYDAPRRSTVEDADADAESLAHHGPEGRAVPGRRPGRGRHRRKRGTARRGSVRGGTDDAGDPETGRRVHLRVVFPGPALQPHRLHCWGTGDLY